MCFSWFQTWITFSSDHQMIPFLEHCKGCDEIFMMQKEWDHKASWAACPMVLKWAPWKLILSFGKNRKSHYKTFKRMFLFLIIIRKYLEVIRHIKFTIRVSFEYVQVTHFTPWRLAWFARFEHHSSHLSSSFTPL